MPDGGVLRIMTLEEKLGYRIRTLRIAQKLSQHHMGRLLGVSRSTVVRLEKRASWPLEDLERVAHALGTTLDHLMKVK